MNKPERKYEALIKWIKHNTYIFKEHGDNIAVIDGFAIKNIEETEK